MVLSDTNTSGDAWVKLHADLFASGCARPGGRLYMAQAYRRFAAAYPDLAWLAEREAERCEAEAASAGHDET